MANTETLTLATLQLFLARLGEKLITPTELYLIGGSALYLLGNQRITGDIDYVGNDLPDPTNNIQTTIQQLAAEMHLEVEGVPLAEFIPLPPNAHLRHRLWGQFGNLNVYVFDPYSIALSKIDRGFESDLEDVVFLIRSGHITLPDLETVVRNALPHAKEFSMSPVEMIEHLDAVRKMLGCS